MIEAASFLEAARELGFRLYSGVPCSYLTPFINHVIESVDLHYVAAANEGDAVAIAAGAELGGLRSVVMFQNSGLGNAVSPLSSLTHTFRIPTLLIVTHRGEPGGAADEPQHELMGEITHEMLEVLGIPWERFPGSEDEVAGALERAVQSMEVHSLPFALVMSKGAVEPSKLRSRPGGRPVGPGIEPDVTSRPTATRTEMLAAVRSAGRPDDVLIATTGYTGRELWAAGDAPNQFYMVGSMGCAASLGLGIALAHPGRRVVALDGDGAALMRMGAFATLGYERPANLVHVVLDNGRHESTGGQSTVTHTTDLAAVAAACGYPRIERTTEPAELATLLAEPTDQLCFVHARIVPGTAKDLPRPTLSPPEVASRMREFLLRGSSPAGMDPR